MTTIGDYEIEAELGEGGMAKVYRAKHTFLETVHALKVLDPSYRVNPEARKRFLDEAKIQAKHLDHDNIVKVTNIVATAEHAALVMELVDGPSLESMLAELKNKPAEITRIMIGVLDAVGHAHGAGIIHRDLKPANVLLARENGVLVPKVTDFGIAKVTDASKGGVKKSTHAAARMGTLSYMSPEQIRRAKEVTARSDIFSLGAMLYEMATGEMAFPGDSEYDVMENIVNGRYAPPRQRYPQIDAVHAQVIEKAMATDPAQRYASCAEMAAALRGAAVVAVTPPPRPAPTTPTRAPTPPPSPAAKSKVPLIAGLCIAAAGLGGAAFYVGTRGGAQPVADAGQVATGSAAQVETPLAPDSAVPDPRAFPADGDQPPSDAAVGLSGLRYVITGGSGAPPKVGDKVALHVRSWSLPDKQLANSTIGLPPQELIVQNDPTGEMLQKMTPGATARVWVAGDGKTSKSGYVVAELVSVTPAAELAPCSGTFRSTEGSTDRLTITVDGSTKGECGNYEFVTDGFKGQMRCTGALTCKDGKIEFDCTYSKVTSLRLTGTMSLSCAGAAMVATTTIGNSTKDWLLHRTP